MRHEIHMRGHGFALRPIEPADASLIIELRRDTHRARYLHEIPLDHDSQVEYLNRYFERDADYYFVIQRAVSPEGCPAEGLVGIYDVDERGERAEWGRWILREGSLAAVASAWLIYRVAFERLDLREVYCRTLSDNAPVLSFHDRMGLVRTRHIEAAVEIDEEQQDVIEHVLRREQWPSVAANAERLAARVALRLDAAA
jgi:RimJ/RimL family protein N-acetyltransferase